MAKNSCIPFVVSRVADDIYIERRRYHPYFVSSVCCKNCLPDLERAIKKFKKEVKKCR